MSIRPRRRVRAHRSGLADGDDKCKAFVGIVPATEGQVMANPSVFAIYWGDYFAVAAPDTVRLMNRFLEGFFDSAYMRGLSEYGVSKPRFAGWTTISSSTSAPQPVMSDDDIEDQLNAWLDAGRVPQIQPDFDQGELLYLILCPFGTTLTLPGEDPTELIGYHAAGHRGTFLGLGEPNLFFAAIPWKHPSANPAPQDYADELATAGISHELVEAFTDPDGEGFITDDGCELADICQFKSGAVRINGFLVETYWSNRAFACVAPQEPPPPPPPPRAPWVRAWCEPAEVPFDTPTQVTIHAVDSATGALIAGDVEVGGAKWGRTNTPNTLTLSKLTTPRLLDVESSKQLGRLCTTQVVSEWPAAEVRPDDPTYAPVEVSLGPAREEPETCVVWEPGALNPALQLLGKLSLLVVEHGGDPVPDPVLAAFLEHELSAARERGRGR